MLKVCGCDANGLEKLIELINGSKTVLITGHRNSDFDAVGAGYGIYLLARSLGKPCAIVCDEPTTLSAPLPELIVRQEGEGAVISPREVAQADLSGRLTVLMDTNRASILECDEAVMNCRSLAIIDHHRIGNELTDGNGIFIHEPGYSSCSEIVARLYELGNAEFTPLLCSALMAGIMLDTRDFSQKASAQTFFVTGRLAERGADMAMVRDFFDCSRQHYSQRAHIVTSAQMHGAYAVSRTSITGPTIRTLAPQAANELLTIEGVAAAFVIFKYSGATHISARSDGRVDVSEIMARFGGGGTRSMAAAQLGGMPTFAAKAKLLSYIDDYREKNPDAETFTERT